MDGYENGSGIEYDLEKSMIIFIDTLFIFDLGGWCLQGYETLWHLSHSTEKKFSMISSELILKSTVKSN